MKIHPKDLHSILYYACLYIGEGGTTASESVVLGTPAIYINSLNAGLFDEEQKRGLLYHIYLYSEIISTARMILQDNDYYKHFNDDWQKMINEKIDPTKLLIWFIENYPDSHRIMKENPDYQYNFR